MRALLLAAGLGTRLRPITETVPKCLVPIHGVPLLDLWLARVFAAGIERAVINLHHLPELVRAHVKASRFADRVDFLEEPDLLGTGGTLLEAAALLGDGPGLVVHADNLSQIDLGTFLAGHADRPDGCVATMALFDTDSPQTCGIVELDADGRITAFHEKVPNPPGTLANAAIYVFEPEVTALCAAAAPPPIDLSTQILPGLMGALYSFRIEGYHRDIGSPEALALAQDELDPETINAMAGMT